LHAAKPRQPGREQAGAYLIEAFTVKGDPSPVMSRIRAQIKSAWGEGPDWPVSGFASEGQRYGGQQPDGRA